MSKKFVAIDCGHENCDSGAVRVVNGKEITEVSLNITICNKLISELERHGLRTIRTTGSLNTRTNTANKNKVDILVSIHNNAGGGDGFGTYIYGSGGQAEKLAKSINYQVINVDKLNNAHGNPLKIKNLHMVRETNMPAVLVECAFMDSKDFAAIDTVAELEAFGISIAKGILSYFGITYKEKPIEATKDGFYRVVTGSFKDKKLAEKRMRELEKVGFESFLDYYKK